MLDKLEVEIKNWDNAYSFSSEENGKIKIYTIHSSKLKQKLREIIFPHGISSKVEAQYKGKNSYGDRIIYQPGKDDLPDQLTLISREIIDQQEIDERKEQKKREVEWEQRKEKWKEIETELRILPNSDITRHYFIGRNEDGKVAYEGAYFKSETQSHLITLEKVKQKNINSSGEFQQIEEGKAESYDDATQLENFQVDEKKNKIIVDNKEYEATSYDLDQGQKAQVDNARNRSGGKSQTLILVGVGTGLVVLISALGYKVFPVK